MKSSPPIRFRIFLMVWILTGCTALYVAAQETTIKLPTTDDTSGFSVTGSDDTTLMGVKGDGDMTVSGSVSAESFYSDDDVTVSGSVSAESFHGDGSALTNVRPIVSYVQGNFYYQLDPWSWSISVSPNEVRTVSITVPSSGTIHVSGTGFIDWESTHTDYYRAAIIQKTGAWGVIERFEYGDYMSIATDYACADSSNQYASLALSRNFAVHSAGTYAYTLYMDSVYPDSWTAVHDVCLTAMYFPNSPAMAPKEVAPVYKADRWTPTGTLDKP